MTQRFGDVHLSQMGYVTLMEIRRPPYNFFAPELIASLVEAVEYLDDVDDCRAIVLASQGKAFCAGADFQADSGSALFEDDPQRGAGGLYRYAVRLFRARKPVVAAVQGPAIGGGLGLSLVADFRVICENTRFAAISSSWVYTQASGFPMSCRVLSVHKKPASCYIQGVGLARRKLWRWGLPMS